MSKNTNEIENADLGPGDIVRLLGAYDADTGARGPKGTTLYTVVGMSRDDVLLCQGVVECNGVWHPELEDLAVHYGRCVRVHD